MSKFEKELREELTIRKAKYRVKNSAGKYEVVYLETSADQVEQTSDRVFVTPAEKTQITTNKEAIAAETQAREEAVNGLNDRLVVIEGESEGSIKKALKDANAYTDEKISSVNSENEALAGKVEVLEGEMALVDGKISTAKDEAVRTSKEYTDGQISTIDAAYKAADTQVLNDAKSHAELKVQEAKEALEASIGVVDGKVTAAKSELQGNIDALAGKVSTNESEISKLKDAVANKNSNTIVVNTESEIADANSTPKVGDLAYVISSKRAYIYKGVDALSAELVPAGWVVFDEITNELDLVDYLKKDEAASTYRRLDTQIKESDLEETLSTKINNKADKSYVDQELAKKTTEDYVNSKVEEVVAPVRTESAQNKAGLAQEISDRKGEITRVEGLVSAAKTELTESISNVDTKVESVTASLTEKEEALQAEDTKINTRIDNFVPVVDSSEPMGTETGHVWLQLV